MLVHLSGSPHPLCYSCPPPPAMAAQTLPCNHRFLFGASDQAWERGRGRATPLARGLLPSEGPEVKAAQAPGILEGWEPRQVEEGSQ